MCCSSLRDRVGHMEQHRQSGQGHFLHSLCSNSMKKIWLKPLQEPQNIKRYHQHRAPSPESNSYHAAFTAKTLHPQVQGTYKRLFPGCENMRWKNCVSLPEVGKQNSTFSPDFTQPGKSLLEVACMVASPSAEVTARTSCTLLTQFYTIRPRGMLILCEITVLRVGPSRLPFYMKICMH